MSEGCWVRCQILPTGQAWLDLGAVSWEYLENGQRVALVHRPGQFLVWQCWVYQEPQCHILLKDMVCTTPLAEVKRRTLRRLETERMRWAVKALRRSAAQGVE